MVATVIGAVERSRDRHRSTSPSTSAPDLPPEGFPDQPILGRFRTTAAVNGTMEEDGELFLADGTLIARSRQLALLAPFG